NEQLKKQYVITARAKGLSEKVILFKHVLKNSLTSLVTILGMSRKELKDYVADKLNATVKEMTGIENFCDMVCDETIADDSEGVLA
ncbi:hypothetical protein ACTPEF_25025, partial [Clostridioides difficile]